MLPRCLYDCGASTTLFSRLYTDSCWPRSRYACFEHVQNKCGESVELSDHEDPDSTTFLLLFVTIGHVFGHALIVVEQASMCERGVRPNVPRSCINLSRARTKVNESMYFYLIYTRNRRLPLLKKLTYSTPNFKMRPLVGTYGCSIVPHLIRHLTFTFFRYYVQFIFV